MATFDIITASSKAYQTSWGAREYLLKLAIVPFAMKLLCFTLAAVYAGDEQTKGNIILFTLIMLPAFAAEGWMLSHYVRFLVMGQRWPFRATGDFEQDMSVLTSRARGILSGIIVFVLMHMALGLFSEATMQYFSPYLGEEAKIPAQVAVASAFVLAASFWGFRLLWLYIPYALNMDAKTYIHELRGLGTSLHMIGAWVLCTFPFIIVPYLFSGMPAFVGIVVTAAMDTLSGVIITAGIVYGLQEIFARKKA